MFISLIPRMCDSWILSPSDTSFCDRVPEALSGKARQGTYCRNVFYTWTIAVARRTSVHGCVFKSTVRVGISSCNSSGADSIERGARCLPSWPCEKLSVCNNPWWRFQHLRQVNVVHLCDGTFRLRQLKPSLFCKSRVLLRLHTFNLSHLCSINI
jgi:hypothetical protein